MKQPTKKENNVHSAVTDDTKLRQSNLELFRIITMLLIVAHHYVINSGLIELMYQSPSALNSLFLFLFGAWGKTGINCFVFITGYFMCKSSITLKKFAKLILEIEFYKITIWLIFLLNGYQAFSLIGMVKVLLPIYSVNTGFTSCYLLFYLFIPFMNILIKSINEKMHLCLIALCIFIYTILGNIPKIYVTMNYVSWFITLYFISSYVRLYHKKLFSNTKLWGWMTVASVLLSILSVFASILLGEILNKQIAYYFVSDSNKFFALLTAFSAFLFFKNVKMSYQKFINLIASSSFGVLMIHANSDVMRQWLWKDFLKNTQMYNSPYIVIHAVCSVLGIYIVCTIIDQIRIYFLEKPFIRLWNKHWDGLNKWFLNKEISICNKFNIGE